jgi:hypothetical protein
MPYFTQNSFDPFKFYEVTEELNRTEAINYLPRNLFKTVGIIGTQLPLYEREGKNGAIPFSVRGGNPFYIDKGKAILRVVTAHHLLAGDTIDSTRIQEYRDWKTNKKINTLDEEKSVSYANLMESLEISEIHLQLSAIKGFVANVDEAENKILDLYELYGFEKPEIELPFSSLDSITGDGSVAIKEVQVGEWLDNLVLEHMRKKLRRYIMTGVEAWCSESFFSNLIRRVPEAYKRERGETSGWISFKFNNINFVKLTGTYPSAATDKVYNFVEDGKAHFFPLGSSDMFVRYNASPYLKGLVDGNKKGKRVYGLESMDKYETRLEILMEMDPLFMCHNPEMCIEATFT